MVFPVTSVAVIFTETSVSSFNVPSSVPTLSSYVQLVPFTVAETGVCSSISIVTASVAASAFESSTVPPNIYLLFEISL